MSDVLIILGSSSDEEYGLKAHKVLSSLSISSVVRISSAHRTPSSTKEIISKAREEGYKVIIAVAGLAAHLPGVCAAYTTLPVIGVPVETGPLQGVDALYSTVMMPPGIPVASVAVGSAGATNAAVLAASILSVSDERVANELAKYREQMAEKVIAADKELQEKIAKQK